MNRVILRTTFSVLIILIAILLFIIFFPKLPISYGVIAKVQAYTLSTRKIILYSFFNTSKTKIKATDAKSIVKTIVRDRTKNNYLYTGGHYTDFYIRNLGTFANKLLDPQSADNANEWLERISLIDRSTELALTVFSSYNEITTTIVQLENGKYVPINIYVQPSDSLPSLLKVLYQLKAIHTIPHSFDLNSQQQFKLIQIETHADALLQHYSPFLKTQSEKYVNEYTDASGLIKNNLALSGIKDAWIRQSSLYDNVMLYALYDYNVKLNIHPDWKNKTEEIKSKIISERWNDKLGIFYDEYPAQDQKYFSADTLIAYEMGMLQTKNATDIKYLKQSVDYIQAKKLDQPFPLHTTEIRIPSKEHLPVRLFAPNYIGTTIWSYWGMVYINLLIDLNQPELARAELMKYQNNIEKYRGFPELYNPDGSEYKTLFYRSVNDMVWGIYYLYLDNKLKAVQASAAVQKDD